MKILLRGLCSTALVVAAGLTISPTSAASLFEVTFDLADSFLFFGPDLAQFPLALGNAEFSDTVGSGEEFDSTDIEGFEIGLGGLYFSDTSSSDDSPFIFAGFVRSEPASSPSSSLAAGGRILNDGNSTSVTETFTQIVVSSPEPFPAELATDVPADPSDGFLDNSNPTSLTDFSVQTVASSSEPFFAELYVGVPASDRTVPIGGSDLDDGSSASLADSPAQILAPSSVLLSPELVAEISASALADFVGGSALDDGSFATLVGSSDRPVLLSPELVAEIPANALSEAIGVNTDGDFLDDGLSAVIANAGTESSSSAVLPVFITFDVDNATANSESISLAALNEGGAAVPEPSGIAGLVFAGLAMAGFRLKRCAKKHNP